MQEEIKETYKMDDVKIVPEEVEAVVYGMYKTTAKDIYKESAKRPEQIKLVLQVENAEFNVKTILPITFYEKEHITNRTHLGKIINRYTEKYGKKWFLGIGCKLIIGINEKGFWEIKL